MINKDGGAIFRFCGGHSCYEGDIELMGVPPLAKTLLYLDRPSLLFSFFPFLASSFESIPNAHSFVSIGVQNRSNAEASDYLMHAERIFILWLQNRETTEISYQGI